MPSQLDDLKQPSLGFTCVSEDLASLLRAGVFFWNQWMSWVRQSGSVQQVCYTDGVTVGETASVRTRTGGYVHRPAKRKGEAPCL